MSNSADNPTALAPTAQYRRIVTPARKARAILSLTKPLQTALLLVTGLCAYALSLPGQVEWLRMLAGGLALGGTIGGCTALNMVLDRDIDSLMGRTTHRPLPARLLTVRTAIIFGLVLSGSGLVLAWVLGPVFGAVVSTGFAVDLVVYTLWLKRRTPFSILWGGVSGGMPALAGRVLALGRVDGVGILLAAGVLLWIPSHILTLATHYAREYRLAGVPVWPNVYGPTATRRLVAAATLLDVVVLESAGLMLAIHPLALGVMGVLGLVLAVLSVVALIRPSEALNWVLFKFASVYMLSAFVCLTIGAVL